MTVNLNKCKPGDLLVTSRGNVVVYEGPSDTIYHPEYAHQVSAKGLNPSYHVYTDEGFFFYDEGDRSPSDDNIIAVLDKESFAEDLATLIKDRVDEILSKHSENPQTEPEETLDKDPEGLQVGDFVQVMESPSDFLEGTVYCYGVVVEESKDGVVDVQLGGTLYPYNDHWYYYQRRLKKVDKSSISLNIIEQILDNRKGNQ